MSHFVVKDFPRNSSHRARASEENSKTSSKICSGCFGMSGGDISFPLNGICNQNKFIFVKPPKFLWHLAQKSSLARARRKALTSHPNFPASRQKCLWFFSSSSSSGIRNSHFAQNVSCAYLLTNFAGILGWFLLGRLILIFHFPSWRRNFSFKSKQEKFCFIIHQKICSHRSDSKRPKINSERHFDRAEVKDTHVKATRAKGRGICSFAE